jgi:hypothetical protein
MTAKTKSERLRRLLSHGYFAPELPPCFVSDDLAINRRSICDGIYALPAVNGRPAFHRFVSEPSWFYFPRFGKDDRRHGVPNPISYLLLAKVVADNYVDLRKRAKKSGISASPPVFDWSGPRALMRPNVDLRDDFRVDLSSRREEFVSADIRAFFHSIYTHAIPWAIYGKTWAKGNRGIAHYGNLIDLLCRNSQDGQTIGLPVGPDTSRLIAEVIASAVDVKLREKLKVTGRDASRYIDDYTISGVDDQSGAGLIAALRQSAALFELELNNDKSAIFPTSVRQNTGWKQAVRAHVPRGIPDYTAIQHFFYEVGQVCDTHPEINVEKYALQNARSAFVRAGDWKRIQSNLINANRRNSSLISFLVEILILRQVERGDVDSGNIKDFVEHRIPVLARANRTGEIIWLLFLAIRLDIVLPATRLAPLFELENAMVALLVTHANSRQLITGAIDLQIWNRSLNSDGLKGPMWLYAYESVVQAINPGVSSTFIEQDSFFCFLHAKKVRFLVVDTGFTSMATTLKSLKNDNDRMRRLRREFSDDFEFGTEEFDDTEDYDTSEDDIGY